MFLGEENIKLRKVLVAEDEDVIRDFIVINLNRAGYNVIETTNGVEALEKYSANQDIDIVLLDVMMPEKDGFSVCKEIRQNNKDIGIIMLTAKTQEMDKISGLMMGADDYIAKPFSPSELVARIDALYRRVALAQTRAENNLREKIVSGDFTLNLRNRVLLKNDVVIELTQVEFQIIEYFFSNPGTPLDRTDILKYVWGESYIGEEKVVDVNIRRLRMKIEDTPSNPKHIITVWGLGYKWEN